jgi:uncharacterized protein (DUF362 family)/Pyruvate/2-oxoacid:ferredoxin oxidoreductase delta subunit
MAVYLEECNAYNENLIKTALISIFNKLGGIENIIYKDMRVALKPNLLMPKAPDTAANTHPLIVKAIADLIINQGAKPFIIDSPGGPYTELWLDKVYKTSGMTDITHKSFINLNYDLRSEQKVIDNPLIMEKVQVLKPLLEADYIINIPKLKTHGMMVITGAVKNMFGAVPGEKKIDYHMNFPNYSDFSKALIDTFNAVKPDLNIVDAVYAMDGAGPSGGEPYNLGLIAASTSGYELEYMSAKLVNIESEKVPVLKTIIDNKLLSDEKIQELDSDENYLKYRAENFKIPMKDNQKAVEFFKPGFVGIITRIIRPDPRINRSKCTNCNTCVRVCPAKTISKSKNTPDINLKNCIRCFCCQELCPESAIKIKKSPIFNFFLNIGSRILPLIHRIQK